MLKIKKGIHMQNRFFNKKTLKGHPIVPDYNNGSYPQFCDDDYIFDPTEIDVFIHFIYDYDKIIDLIISLLNDLDEYWPSYYNEDTKFWAHEWDKHGTCSKDLAYLKNEKLYFSHILNIYHYIDVVGKLQNASIVPSCDDSYKTTEIMKALQQNFTLECIEYKVYFYHVDNNSKTWDSGYIGDAHDTPGIIKIAVKKPTQCVTQLQIKEHDQQCTIRSFVERFFGRLKQAFSVFSGIYRYNHQNFDIDFDNTVLLTNELICKTELTDDDQKYQKKLYAKIMDKEDHIHATQPYGYAYHFVLSSWLLKDLKLVRRIEKKGVFGFMGIQESNPIVFDNVQPSIIAFLTTWLVEARFSVVVDIFSKTRSKLDVNRGIMRLRLIKLTEIDYASLCNKHHCQGSH
ncbi:hypothetical protein A3Q56_03301 [Intoshia linei]|uniref:Uncharacterized protein n=1 Tax=Intoshia linei TaxID=1819745 RepID=A0A177B3S6_9BILA|nr:hypothetical protein A3Q56_03301 [Intoshia linei]